MSAAAGLACPSVYRYFSSGAEILAAVIEDAFGRANDALHTALDPVTDPAEQIDAYVRETLRLAHEGAHRAAAARAGAPLPDECRARLAELHRGRALPLLAALRELGVPEPGLTAQLLGGARRAAMAAVEAGVAREIVTTRTLALVRAAVAAR